MIHWMCGHIRLDMIKNAVIRDKIEVTSINDKMRETRLRWFGHIRRSMNALVKRCERIVMLKEYR